MFLNVSGNLSYKQLNTYLKNKYIMGLQSYTQNLIGAIKPLNNYII